MAQHQPTRSSTALSEIPDKLYFRIGEVARLCDVPAYVLRFWESEFPQLRPNKGGTGQRLFRRRDVETALRIRRLLYDEGYTIPGARQILKTDPIEKPQLLPLALVEQPGTPPKTELRKLQQDLRDLLAFLGRPAGRAQVHSIRGPRVVRQRRTASLLFDSPADSLNPGADRES